MTGIIDYGVGNLHSVSKALAALGVESRIVSDGRGFSRCDRLILPGVGAFQFRQKSQHEARLLLVRQTPDAVIDEASILAQLKKVLPDTVVAIEYVDEIAPTASGKLRYAIRECPLPDGRKTS